MRRDMSLGNRMGERAPDFTLQDGGGRETRLQDYAGSWLLMVFHRHLA